MKSMLTKKQKQECNEDFDPRDARASYIVPEDTVYILNPKYTKRIVRNYMKKIGKRGGESTKKKNPNHFREIGKKGAAKRWKKN